LDTLQCYYEYGKSGIVWHFINPGGMGGYAYITFTDADGREFTEGPIYPSESERHFGVETGHGCVPLSAQYHPAEAAGEDGAAGGPEAYCTNFQCELLYNIPGYDVTMFTFELYRRNAFGDYDIFVGRYSPDRTGSISAFRLNPGQYMFKEVLNVLVEGDQNFSRVWGPITYEGGLFFEITERGETAWRDYAGNRPTVTNAIYCKHYIQMHHGVLDFYGCDGGYYAAEYVPPSCEQPEAWRFYCVNGDAPAFAIYGAPALGHDFGEYYQISGYEGYIYKKCARCYSGRYIHDPDLYHAPYPFGRSDNTLSR